MLGRDASSVFPRESAATAGADAAATKAALGALRFITETEVRNLASEWAQEDLSSECSISLHSLIQDGSARQPLLATCSTARLADTCPFATTVSSRGACSQRQAPWCSSPNCGLALPPALPEVQVWGLRWYQVTYHSTLHSYPHPHRATQHRCGWQRALGELTYPQVPCNSHATS